MGGGLLLGGAIPGEMKHIVLPFVPRYSLEALKAMTGQKTSAVTAVAP